MLRKLTPFILFIFIFAAFPVFSQDKTDEEKMAEDLLKVLEETKQELKVKEEVKDEKPEAKEEVEPKEVKADKALSEKVDESKVEPKDYIESDGLISPAIYGQTGLFRMYSAQRMPASWTSFSMSLHGEWFRQKNFITVGDEISRWRGTLAMTYVPIEYLEIFTSISGFTNTGKSAATLLQRMGDLRVGLKGGYDVSNLFSFGANFTAEILNAAGDTNISGHSYNYGLMGLVTFDFLKAMNYPVRLHANMGYKIDRSSSTAGSTLLGSTERFFLEYPLQNQITFGVGAEIPYHVVSLFVEYTSEQILSYTYGTSPQRVTTGIKGFPTKDKNLTFDVGVDFRIQNSDPPSSALAIPNFNIIFGMTYSNFGIKPVREIPKALPATGKLSGAVMDFETNLPIAGAVIAFEGNVHPTIVTNSETGEYMTADLPAGLAKVTVSKDGYEAVTQEPNVVAGETVRVDYQIKKVKKLKGSALFTVTDADDKPLNGSLQFEGYRKIYQINTAKGGLKVKLKEGDYKVKIMAKGFESEDVNVNIKGGETTKVRTILREVAKKVVIEKDKIKIMDKIHFASGKSEIRTDSFALLNRVADLISDHPEIKKVRIEGYTDSTGPSQLNLDLSQKRSEAVMEYLIIRGIARERIEAKGYGETNFIATNKTSQGRAINRRVEFTILNQ